MDEMTQKKLGKDGGANWKNPDAISKIIVR